MTPILATSRVFISTSIFGVLREAIMSGEDFFLITLPVENNRERTWQVGAVHLDTSRPPLFRRTLLARDV